MGWSLGGGGEAGRAAGCAVVDEDIDESEAGASLEPIPGVTDPPGRPEGACGVGASGTDCC